MKYSLKSIFVLTVPILMTACSTFQKKGSTDTKQAEFTPKLKRPEVRKVWVSDQITGDEYVTGHWKYVLEKNAVWTKEK